MNDFRPELREHFRSSGDSDGVTIVQNCINSHPDLADCEICAALYDMEFDRYPEGYDDGYVHTAAL